MEKTYHTPEAEIIDFAAMERIAANGAPSFLNESAGDLPTDETIIIDFDDILGNN